MDKRRQSKEELAEELQTKFEKRNANADSDAEDESERETGESGDDPNRAPSDELDEAATPDRPERSEQGSARESGRDRDGSSPGDFTALTHAQVEEVNKLFTLINSSGYLTIGDYSVHSDGEGNVTVSLTALTPSSGGTPDELNTGDS